MVVGGDGDLDARVRGGNKCLGRKERRGQGPTDGRFMTTSFSLLTRLGEVMSKRQRSKPIREETGG